MKGKFIVFEGVDGSGKTTIINKLRDEYVSDGRFLFTKEFSTPLGRKIREIITGFGHELDQYYQAQLSAISRCDYIENIIKPALDEGKIVISDRYIDSFYVYQNYLYNEQFNDYIINLHMKTFKPDVEIIKPDLTFIFDCDPNVTLERIKSYRETDVKETKENLEKVHNGYQKLLDESHGRHKYLAGNKVQIDAEKNIDSVYETVKNCLKLFFPEVFCENYF